MGSVDNSRIRTTPIRNAGFVSFFVESGCVGGHHTDFHDTRLRWQKRRRLLALVAITAAVTWVAVESAQALSIF